MSLTPICEVALMTFLEARNKVLQALEVAVDVFNEPELSSRLRDPSHDLTFAELELDSLAAIECCMALEDDISIDFDPADLTIHNSINKLAKHIVQRTTAA
jgi:acyl carrier protein